MRTSAKWTALTGIVGALIIIPFLTHGHAIDACVLEMLEGAARHRLTVALLLGGLLAADIVLPVPSSIASTGCGAAVGFTVGTLVSWAGMTISCIVGYGIGRFAGDHCVARFMGASSMERLRRLGQRFGPWVVVLTRPVPVLAESAVLFAGLGRMPFLPFMVMTAAANLGISLIYAAVGAFAVSTNSFLAAFAAAILFPGLLMLVSPRKPTVCVQPRARPRH